MKAGVISDNSCHENPEFIIRCESDAEVQAIICAMCLYNSCYEPTEEEDRKNAPVGWMVGGLIDIGEPSKDYPPNWKEPDGTWDYEKYKRAVDAFRLEMGLPSVRRCNYEVEPVYAMESE